MEVEIPSVCLPYLKLAKGNNLFIVLQLVFFENIVLFATQNMNAPYLFSISVVN